MSFYDVQNGFGGPFGPNGPFGGSIWRVQDKGSHHDEATGPQPRPGQLGPHHGLGCGLDLNPKSFCVGRQRVVGLDTNVRVRPGERAPH